MVQHKRSIDILNKVYHLHVRETKTLGQMIVRPTLGYSEVDLVLLNSVHGSVKKCLASGSHTLLLTSSD
jgi:hypothetical protein